MSIYGWVALVAVLMKVYIGVTSSKYEWASVSWFFLVSAFLMQNLVEWIGYYQLSLGVNSEYLLKVYYITLSFLLFAVLMFVSDKQSRVQSAIVFAYLSTSALLTIAILFTPYIIVGYQSGTFPPVAIKGDYFPIYLYTSLSSVFVSLSFIGYNVVNGADAENRRYNFYNLVSLLPFFLTCIVVGGGILLGFKVNGTGAFPISSSLFMLSILILRCKPHYIVDSAIPFTESRSIFKQGGMNVITATNGDQSLKQMHEAHEELILKCFIDKMGKNKSLLSKQLGIDRKTLSRKLKKHELWWEG